MSVVLVCSPVPLLQELSQTVLGRAEVQRHEVGRFDEAVSMALALRPQVVVIHRQLPRAAELVAALRADARTLECVIVVVAEPHITSSDLGLLRSGANVILHLPVGPDWHTQLEKILRVAPRRDARLTVQFELEASLGNQQFTGYTVNLSLTGMLMHSPVVLAMGDGLQFTIHMTEGKVEGSGTVVRKAGEEQYAIFFERLQGGGREHIERHLKSLA